MNWNKKSKIRMQNDKEKFKDGTLCHCEPEQSEGVAIPDVSDEIASVASLSRNDLFLFTF